MQRRDKYPLKYSDMIISDKKGTILEAGCGAGRILRAYHDAGHDIVGIDFIEGAVEKLQKIDASLQVQPGDITQLQFADGSFRSVLAFGLYHNLDEALDKAVEETYRVLEPGGWLCASFRSDNIQNAIIDWLAEHKEKERAHKSRLFHKMNLTKKEFADLLTRHGFIVHQLYPVENFPFLYKFRRFRALSQKTFNEHHSRTAGYRLSPVGQMCQKVLIRLFPFQFCNVYVIIAKKPERDT
jgi:SAM-dependent methyltransferase